MDIYTMLASVTTVVTFVVFCGIVVWAYSARNRDAFEIAANEPFALPDESQDPAQQDRQRARR